MNKKVIILTGGTDGIGRNSLNYLINEDNLKLILPIRNLEKGEKVIQELKLINSNIDITTMEMDLSSFESIKSFVNEFNKLGLPLHTLVNNAGIMSPIYKKTVNGFESTFGTNYLGTFLLTNLLLPNLKKSNTESDKGNIVIVTSRMHYYVSTLDIDNLENINESNFSSGNEYNKSKVCDLLFAFELNNRLKSDGYDKIINVNSIHPGFQITSLSKDHGWFSNYIVLPILTFFLGNNINDMGKALAEISLNKSNVNGKYFQLTTESQPSKLVTNNEISKSLWEKTIKLLEL
ncbi:hypothetical protein DDB_G0286575 [Dictyostelium discoideum AX4]|uniref:Short-chain dehydrogenase/reductase family protein n=1 Tax=Dictyostelium discoideum TaxID=44689 RepID=Q54LM1_DICDI|nr:hypothetical protein DDB_G0286575 [Dictyostelium discoideum AX4]EAL64043.1 hypothetical protein DDB_G0286575 [Dictyostelium discoideum AX4]|eukprot:XP_637540.1 hypothetical protein DDB_G0286575 [Dictyostelium discoideum AX4]